MNKRSPSIKLRLSINLTAYDLGLTPLYHELLAIERNHTSVEDVAEHKRRHLLGILYAHCQMSRPVCFDTKDLGHTKFAATPPFATHTDAAMVVAVGSPVQAPTSSPPTNHTAAFTPNADGMELAGSQALVDNEMNFVSAATSS